MDSRFRGNDGVDIESIAKKLTTVAFAWFAFQSPLPRLRLERQMESGEDCLSAEGTSSAAAHMRR